jgi:hypothetical protein
VKRPALLVTLLVVGCECYLTNTPTPDAAIDAFVPPPDAAFSWCQTLEGAYRCWSDDCPVGICTSCFPLDSTDAAQSLCFGGLGDPNGTELCNLGNSTCRDGKLCALFAAEPAPQAGGCGQPEVCATLRARDANALCHYLDGTPFMSGAIPSSPCPEGLRGLACGPACGECDPGFRCFGPSEHSGVGHCGLADNSPDRPACGTVGDTTFDCVGGRRCLHFVAPGSLPAFGSCLDPASCQLLAERMPERFRCD